MSSSFSRFFFLFLIATLARAQSDVRIGVLGLFHPRELDLSPTRTQALIVSNGQTTLLLNGEPGRRHLLLRAVDDRIVFEGLSAASWFVTAHNEERPRFQLSVPDKIRRLYQGNLTITAHRGELVAVVTMDRELAVASIVASELPSNAPLEALKAQAVVSRSFLAAGSRHHDFDFCDTTHCQFLRSPDDVGPRAVTAVQTTRGFILAYRHQTLAAMYSSRCGGETQSLSDIGSNPGNGYPYYSVPCRWCRAHPMRWQSRLNRGGAPPKPGSESSRLAFARQWGWSALPGNRFTIEPDSQGAGIQGQNLGHGVGMCQFGAMGMATGGFNFRAILAHYYPNSELIQIP